jgi:hypothetical protein
MTAPAIPPHPSVYAPPIGSGTVWPERVWPFDRTAAAPPTVFAGAAVAGLVAAVVLRIPGVSVGYLLTGVAAIVAAFGTGGIRLAWDRLVPAAAACALLGVGTFRAAGWLMALCVLAAWAVASLAFVGGRTWTGLLVGSAIAWLTPARAVGWVVRGRPAAQPGRVSQMRIAVVVGVTVLAVLVFGGLFASADPAYSRLVHAALPLDNVPDLIGRAFLFGIVAAAVLAAGYLLRFTPRFDGLAPAPGRPFHRLEWAVPLAMLDLLFASFVALRLAALFGGREHVLATAGLTYAEYARQGFWQLLAVTILTLGIVALAIRKAGRASRGDRVLLRLLLGGLAALALVIVVSAAHRMSVYEQAYGFTRLRFVVSGTEVWLGMVLGLVLLAGVRMRATWLPRAIVGSAAAALLALAAINPDAYVAARNVERWNTTRKIDVSYLSTLSPDAAPALDRLPAGLRACALGKTAVALTTPDSWNEFNLGRVRARSVLRARPAGVCAPTE